MRRSPVHWSIATLAVVRCQVTVLRGYDAAMHQWARGSEFNSELCELAELCLFVINTLFCISGPEHIGGSLVVGSR